MSKGKRNVKKRKSNDRNKIETVNNFDGNIWNKIFVALGVICFILAFYLLTLYITNKNTKKANAKEDEEVTVSSDKIIIGRSLSMSDDDYFVIFYDKGDSEIASTYDEIVSNQKYGGDGRKIYTVDMSSGFNKKYLTTEESNKTPKDETDFKINGPTLILVSNHSVVDYIEGEEAIKDYLG